MRPLINLQRDVAKLQRDMADIQAILRTLQAEESKEEKESKSRWGRTKERAIVVKATRETNARAQAEADMQAFGAFVFGIIVTFAAIPIWLMFSAGASFFFCIFLFAAMVSAKQ